MFSDVVKKGPARAPARAMLRATGLSGADIERPLVAVANTWTEVTPCNLHLRAPRDEGEGGDPGGGGDPDRVQHDRHLRRDLDGDRRDARLARLARGDRRLDRAVRQRALLRRRRGHLGLRQDDPGDGDGDRAPRPSRGGALRRLDPARELPRHRHHDPGRLRGRGRLLGRQDERERAARHRGAGLPRRRVVRRAVHGQHDGDGSHVPRDLADGGERRPRHRSAQGRRGVRLRPAGDGAPEGGADAATDPDPGRLRERDRFRGRDRRLDECRPPPPRDRARGGRPARAGRLRRDLRPDADPRRPEAGGPVHGRGHGARGRRPPRGEAAGRRGPSHGRPHGHGPDDLRRGEERRRDPRAGRHPPRSGAP